MSRERALYMEIDLLGRSFICDHAVLDLVSEEEPEVLEAILPKKKTEEIEEADGTYEYSFGNPQTTDSTAKKEKIAGDILKIVTPKLKTSKKHTTLEKIVAALTEENYKKGDKITFDVFKMTEKITYPKINSAPIGYQVYLKLKTRNLKGKKARVKIFENGEDLKILTDKEAVLPVLVFANLDDKKSDNEVADWISIDIDENEEGVKKDTITSQGGKNGL